MPLRAILDEVLRPRLNAQAGSMHSEIVELLLEAGVDEDLAGGAAHRIIGVFSREVDKAGRPDIIPLGEMMLCGRESGIEKPPASMEPDRFCMTDPDEVSKKGGHKS